MCLQKKKRTQSGKKNRDEKTSTSEFCLKNQLNRKQEGEFPENETVGVVNRLKVRCIREDDDRTNLWVYCATMYMPMLSCTSAAADAVFVLDDVVVVDVLLNLSGLVEYNVCRGTDSDSVAVYLSSVSLSMIAEVLRVVLV